MANLGLIQGIATGLREGVNSYRTERERQDRLAQEAEDREMKNAAFEQEKIKNKAALDKMMQDKIQAQNKEYIDMAQLGGVPTRDDTGLITGHSPQEGLVKKSQMSPHQEAMLALALRGDARAERSASRAERKEEQEFKKASLGTEGERSAATYATRMHTAEKDLQEIVGGGFDPTAKKQALMGYAPDMFKPENTKRFENAKKNFLAAVLRKESGAAISASEYSEGDKIYFPSPGDTPATLEQKARNRQDAMAGVELSAGPALAQIKPEQPTGFLPKKPPGLVKTEQTQIQKPINKMTRAEKIAELKALGGM